MLLLCASIPLLLVTIISCVRIHPLVAKSPSDSNNIGTVKVEMHGGIDSAKALKTWRKEITDSITSKCLDYAIVKIYITSEYRTCKVTYYPKKDGQRSIWQIDSTEPKVKYLNYDFKCK
jgi:hypothetical protein